MKSCKAKLYKNIYGCDTKFESRNIRKLFI